MRLVLDTNVVVAATLWRGATYRFLELVRQQSDSISVFASAPLLAELAEVLVRPAMTQRLAAISRNAANVLGDYAALVEIVEPIFLS
jgi:putative PIN family toxin of toxin-antitoxin system